MRRDSQTLIRCSSEEKESFQRAAELEGLSVSSWIRQRLRAAAENELSQRGEEVPFLEVARSKKDRNGKVVLNGHLK